MKLYLIIIILIVAILATIALTGYIYYLLTKRFFDNCKGLFLLIHIIERQEVLLVSQEVLMKPVRLTHKAPETVALNRSLEERFRRPDKHLCLLFSRLKSDPQRPGREAFALFIECRNTHLTA